MLLYKQIRIFTDNIIFYIAFHIKNAYSYLQILAVFFANYFQLKRTIIIFSPSSNRKQEKRNLNTNRMRNIFIKM